MTGFGQFLSLLLVRNESNQIVRIIQLVGSRRVRDPIHHVGIRDFPIVEQGITACRCPRRRHLVGVGRARNFLFLVGTQLRRQFARCCKLIRTLRAGDCRQHFVQRRHGAVAFRLFRYASFSASRFRYANA
ncbi:hypothetical protein KEH56_36490 [Burkholderia cenocepacia]|nr:hypothetical protein KEH56_36490 [Burkholderia cenocepacia]